MAERLDHFMARAVAAYYAARDPFGTTGDFTTAPEMTQAFGECLGLWAAGKRKWWADLEASVQPLITDLFAEPPATQYPAPTPIQAPAAPAPLAPPPADASLFAPIAF